jgi:hypothetical protein
MNYEQQKPQYQGQQVRFHQPVMAAGGPSGNKKRKSR